MDYPEAERLRNRIKHLESRTNTLSDRYRAVSKELYEARDKLKNLNTRIEPHNHGTLVRFNHRYSPGGRDYEFFALKLSDGRWVTSSTYDNPARNSALPRYTNWQRIMAFVGHRDIDVVTQYERFQGDTDGVKEWNEYFRQFQEPASWVNAEQARVNVSRKRHGLARLTYDEYKAAIGEPTEHPDEGMEIY